MKVFLLFLLIFFTSRLMGQGSATGCLIPFEQRVYPNNSLNLLANGNQIFLDTNPKSLSANYCSWTPNSTSITCSVCSGLGLCLSGICVCLGTPKSGFVGTFSMVICPLDDYSWALGASAAALGLIVIRKRKLF